MYGIMQSNRSEEPSLPVQFHRSNQHDEREYRILHPLNQSPSRPIAAYSYCSSYKERKGKER